MTMYYDIVIIGGGIAGLYSAYTIMKLSPNTRFVVLEKYKKNWLGGRMNTELFYDTPIVTGAGVIRKKKDTFLMNLIRELDIPMTESKFNPHFPETFSPVDVKKVMTYLRGVYKSDKYISKDSKSVTFKQFAEPILGKEDYHRFITTVGYTDYENEDAFETLYHYGMEDNTCCWDIIHIYWKQLITQLCNSIGMKNIKTSSDVIKIQKVQNSPCQFVIETKKGTTYVCNKVIMATTIESLRKLMPTSLKNNIYHQIEGQPFLRLYGKFNKKSISIMKDFVPRYTIVEGPLQKIIPMNSDNGIYMISYSDNNNAKFLKNHLENTPENRDYFCRLIEKALGIEEGVLKLNAISDYYWPIGTHYHKPLQKNLHINREEFLYKAQHPDKGMLVVGEVVSRNQGWSEGALESVKLVLTKKWIQEKDC